ncbi:hypothetical protein C481_16160 [Natrialba asiatica DSM 12278]|uniref:Uncharacterized protein n=1 Tax=Natrialba asiatica (strain ATCC 700177 / DSM 12278 / JCM 9576 / FERM P-10747 / NBRC 102637 / 172P1) TaxID=29540 RepID=M0AM28_NATA1|nr:hypothetical protein C481_16160 [Natrialba asiatica DSM 12278]
MAVNGSSVDTVETAVAAAAAAGFPVRRTASAGVSGDGVGWTEHRERHLGGPTREPERRDGVARTATRSGRDRGGTHRCAQEPLPARHGDGRRS